jgi:hypothetical protein
MLTVWHASQTPGNKPVSNRQTVQPTGLNAMKKPFSCNKPFSITRKVLVVPVFAAFPMRASARQTCGEPTCLAVEKDFEPDENGLTLT